MILGKSVKTTLIGYGGAVALALAQYLQTGEITFQGALLCVVIAILGRAAKDAGVTGT